MSTPIRNNGIPTRILGKTGVRISVLGIGGHHIGKKRDPSLAEKIIRTAIDAGVTFLDNASCYHDGESERYMGNALRDGYRDRVFLMTKNHGRDAATFRHQLEESLKRLGTDRIDLLQFHEIIHEGEPSRIFSEGAIEEALRARKEGKIRFIGFTGHKWPRLFRQMLEKDFDWDTVQMPLNALDYHFRSFTGEILPILVERGTGVIAMKTLAGSRLLRTGLTPREGIIYALSLPVHTAVTGVDSLEVLQQNLEIARTFQPLTEKEMDELRERVRHRAADGQLEYYKTRED